MKGKLKFEKIQKETESLTFLEQFKLVEGLTPQEQLRLVERIIHKLRETHIAEREPLDWSELYGLGKGLWNGEDAQEYVNKSRENRT